LLTSPQNCPINTSTDYPRHDYPQQRRGGGGQHVAYTSSRVRLPFTRSIVLHLFGRVVVLAREHRGPRKLRKTTHITRPTDTATPLVHPLNRSHQGGATTGTPRGGVDCN